MVRRGGICLLLAVLLLSVVPAQAVAAPYVPSFAFAVSGVVNGMTYYEPVTLTLGASGPIDFPPGPEYRLDGLRIYSGQVIDRIGTHTLVMTATSLGVPKTLSLTFTIEAPPQWWLKPVFRFYRPGMGTHFYTASATERDSVVVNLGRTYSFEGVAYWFDPDYNTQPLYRFYRPSTGTHFYTASESEMQSVRANLPGTYTFEGPAYNVSAAPVDPPCATVYRFLNLRNGTHFYTASESERDSVMATLSDTYQLEGPAYYLAQ